MSNAPFKIAFWMMSLAFGLTILLAGLKPEEIRMALNPEQRPETETLEDFDQLDENKKFEIQPEQINFEVVGIQENPVTPPVIDVQISEELIPLPDPKLPQNILPTPIAIESEPEKFVRIQKNHRQPIRVASADINASLGVGEPQPIRGDVLAPIPDARFTLSSNESISQETTLAKKIMVPDPVDIPTNPRVSLNDEFTELKGKVLRLRLAQARREFDAVRREDVRDEIESVEVELSQLREQIRRLKDAKRVVAKEIEVIPTQQSRESITAITEPPSLPTPKKELEPVAEVAQETLESPMEASSAAVELSNSEEPQPAVETADYESVIEVSAGETEETFHFRFEKAPISEVLETLGKHGGRKVVLAPGIEGTFTGVFEETSANQAFAAVIKANQFGLSFRGNYVLVRAERNPKIR